MAENSIRPLLRRKSAVIMGILNATPDSFSDGGKYQSVDAAVQHGLTLVDEGADILDVGGESTRPGAASIGAQQEIDRVLPVIEKMLDNANVPVSIDTHKPEVMIAAVSAGAKMVNDVNGLRSVDAISTLAKIKVPVCLMHMQGKPQTMQSDPQYLDVVDEVIAFFKQQIVLAIDAGVDPSDIIVDPGIGFGKDLAHNLLLLNNLERLKLATQCEVLVGVSRKSLIQHQLGRGVSERLPASLGLAVQSVLSGAKIVRVHDVRASYDAIRMAEAVLNAE